MNQWALERGVQRAAHTEERSAQNNSAKKKKVKKKSIQEAMETLLVAWSILLPACAADRAWGGAGSVRDSRRQTLTKHAPPPCCGLQPVFLSVRYHYK